MTTFRRFCEYADAAHKPCSAPRPVGADREGGASRGQGAPGRGGVPLRAPFNQALPVHEHPGLLFHYLGDIGVPPVPCH